MALSYQASGLVLKRGGGGTTTQIKDLQRDLRRLGYLRTGIDGIFGRGTEGAVQALQYDLLKNRGLGPDGNSSVRVRDYNRSRVSTTDGLVDQNLAACIADMLADTRFCKVPSSGNPGPDNASIAAELAGMRSGEAPVPFLVGIFRQESNLKHFCEPSPKNDDNFVIVGLDLNAKGVPAITSRGYGVGQYTLFHHPPTGAEVNDFIMDVQKNITKAAQELRNKFDHFVNGNTSGTRADDRRAEFGRGSLRLCKYHEGDFRYMNDCRRCLAEAGVTDIKAGVTSFYEGSMRVYEATQYHPETEYKGVPIRKNIGCDWPYAARRYNGGGTNSYHYQAKVLLHILNG
jgi:peptidoglycan hydrolase-like protein with peptidoglycan-binding domain